MESPGEGRAATFSENEVIKQYYMENDFFFSPEGVLKILSAVVSVVWAVVAVSGASCGAVVAAGWLALASGALLALLAAGLACRLPRLAPQPWLFTDLIVSSVSGVLLLVYAALSLTVCDLLTPYDYVHGPLGLVSAGLVTASAVTSYVSVMRRWDTARGPALEPPRPPPHDLDV